MLTAGGADMVKGGTGDDELYTGWGDDLGFGGTGNDTLYGEAGGDTLYGGDGDDLIDAERDVNVTTTPIDNDFLDGGLGNDTLIGGAGLDTLYGGDGDCDDVLTSYATLNATKPELAVDQVFGGTGIDTLGTFIGQSISTFDVEVLLRTNTLIRIDGVAVVDARQIEAINVTALGTGSGNFEGGAFADKVVSGQGDDRICTYSGNDLIQSSTGSDTI